MNSAAAIYAPRPLPRTDWRPLESLGLDAQGEKAELAARERVESTARDFEAFFIGQMMSLQRKTVEKSELFHGGAGEDAFSGLLDMEYGKLAAQSGSGVGGLIREDWIEKLDGVAGQTARLNARRAYGGLS